MLPIVIGLQAKIDPERAQFQPGKQGVGALMTQVDNNPVVLPGQFMAGALIGFREVIAGLLWVRCDDFFHNGNYETIVPLIRLITWLDPHQIDVYSVGGWHLAYNFTDTAQRADYRYLPASVALLEEGVKQNPGVADLEIDLGFVVYQLKAMDFQNSIYWLNRAADEKTATYTPSRLLAHAYERSGDLDGTDRQWKKCIAIGKRQVAKNPADVGAKIHLGVSLKNYDGFLARRALRADLPKHQTDVHFDAAFKRVGPKVFQISGSINLPKGSRIELQLLDDNFKPVVMKTFSWNIDQNVTELVENGIHGIYVDKHKFSRKYDLSKDVKQYPLKRDSYTLKVIFDPRQNNSADIGNIVGFVGEGLADQKYLDTSEHGVRKLVKVFHLQRKDLL